MVDFNIQTTTRFTEMTRMCGDTSNKVVLDLGAGRYRVSDWLRDYKKRITIDMEGRPDIIHDLNKGIPLENNSIDVIIAGEVIEHLPCVDVLIKDCYRVLKRNGVLVLSVPNCCALKCRIKLLFGVLDGGFSVPELDEENRFEKHCNDFSFVIIHDLLEKSGFEIEDVATNGLISYRTRLFPRCLTPKRLGDDLIIKCRKVNEIQETTRTKV